MVNLMARLGSRGRHNGANAIVHLAREVVGRRRTIQNATQEVRNAVILDALADEDFRTLDTTIAERSTSDREFAQTLARLSYAAARAKGFDRCVVDAALRLDSLIPLDDPVHERDKLLRDAYSSAQKASYIRGGRLALGRLGRRAVEAGDLERARVLLQQQLELGPEKDDTAAEVDSALVLGDILRRENEDDDAQRYYRRAASAAERLEYRQGVAEALVRQIDTTPSANLETVAALQHQALDAAQRTGDQSLEARILVGLAGTLVESDRVADATPYYEQALEIARETADLALEARCVTALAEAHRSLGHTHDAMEAERAALEIEERLGNRPAAARWALSIGTGELRLRNAEEAVEAFEKARLLGGQLGDTAIEQQAEGNLGIANTLLGRGPETVDHLSRAIALARRDRDTVREAEWVASLGQAHWMFGQADDAIRVTTEAIGLAESTRDLTMQADAYTLLGQIYASQRETIRARDCYTRALQLNRDLGQTADQVTTLTALGTLAADTGQFTQATQLLDQALDLALRADDRSTATVLYGRMGSLAQRRGDLRAALGHYQRSVDLAQALGDVRSISRALQHLATAQDVMGDPAAVTSYERAVIAADDIGDVRGGITMRLNMGMLLGRMPEAGAAEDAIGWLSDAANYALEAAPDYADLRQQAEDLIQELGGGPRRDPVRQTAPSSGYRESETRRADDRYAHGPYDDDPMEGDGTFSATDAYHPGNDNRPPDGRGGYGWDDRDTFGPETSPRDSMRVDDDDDDWSAYEPGPTISSRSVDGRSDSGYDDASYDDEGYDDPRYRPDMASRDYPTDADPVDAYADHGDGEPGAYRSRPDAERDRYSPPRETDREWSSADDAWSGQSNSYGTDGDEGSRRHALTDPRDDGYDRSPGSTRSQDRPYDDGYYGATDGNDGPLYGDDQPGYRDRPRDEVLDDGSFSQRVRYQFDRHDSDRSEVRPYDEDRERSHSGYPDAGDDYAPQQRRGRNERASRRESSRRANPNRGLEDEPSDPARPVRRAGLAGLFSRPPRSGQPARADERRHSARQERPRGVPPTGRADSAGGPEHHPHG